MKRAAWTSLVCSGVALLAWAAWPDDQAKPAGREEVVFWHFWGGADRQVVDDIVARFNDSQDTYYVRAVAMPGNNLDLKLFLSVTGGEPPDLVNQDDPILADWARRGALTPLDELASKEELQRLRQWLFPPARRMGEVDGRAYALCNGLDIRALYYDRTLLQEHGLQPPQTIAELDQMAELLTRRDEQGVVRAYGYLPDPRRLWAWGVVFGGQFYDSQTRQVTADSPPIVAALQWMRSYHVRYGGDELASFRQGDQSLPGAAFPLLPTGDQLHGRYALLMDGQWRVRDIAAFQQRRRELGQPVAEYGVCPLPAPPGGRTRAGWVNANFFIVPSGSRQPQGAWQFMKFWSGFDGHQQQAADACAAGGWIPVSPQVVQQPSFQQFLQRRPLFRPFVDLAGSENQFPLPAIPGAALYNREIRRVGELTLYRDDAPPPRQLLQQVARQVQQPVDQAD